MTTYLLTLFALAIVAFCPLFALGNWLLWRYERRRRQRAEQRCNELEAERLRLLAERERLKQTLNNLTGYHMALMKPAHALPKVVVTCPN